MGLPRLKSQVYKEQRLARYEHWPGAKAGPKRIKYYFPEDRDINNNAKYATALSNY